MPVIEVKLKLDKQSSERARRKMAKLQKAVKNPRIANLEVATWLLRWVNENFQTEGGKVGGWAPFKYGGRVVTKTVVDKKTGKRKRNKFATSQSIESRRYINTSAKLLQDTGLLRQKFHIFSSKTRAGIGNNLPYSLYHELGLPLRNLPARRMLPSDKDKDVEKKVIQIYDAHIARAIQ